MVDVYHVGLHKPVDQESDGRKDGKGERVTRAETCGRGQPVSKERHRTTPIVKTLFVEITAALMRVIDYQDSEHRRQVHGTVWIKLKDNCYANLYSHIKVE